MTKKYYVFVKSIMFSLSVTDIALGHPSLIVIWNCSQNCCTQAHLQKRQMIASHSFLQNEQLLSFSIPICFRTTLVPNMLCTSLIWNHFNIVSWISFYFLRGSRPVNIFIQFSFPLLTSVWFIYILCKHFIIKTCSFFFLFFFWV